MMYEYVSIVQGPDNSVGNWLGEKRKLAHVLQTHFQIPSLALAAIQPGEPCGGIGQGCTPASSGCPFGDVL